MEQKLSTREIIARRGAKEVEDGYVINLGIGVPTLIPQFIDSSFDVTFQGENGLLGMGNVCCEEKIDKDVINPSGVHIETIAGASFFDSADSFMLIRGGHVHVTFLGALQADEKGNIANWIIPGKKTPGMGGAMDLLNGAKRVILAMEHTAKGAFKILDQCTLPLTAAGRVNMIITEYGVMDVTDKGLLVTEISPEYTQEQMQEVTGCKLIFAENIKPMF